ncbi:hypothetical protein QR680_006237 [Steinernema hermaphroditum]|uniref:TIL domain-containing protein n=1 Tax=Steinernema hermaphroditum TaxID=289476 RepID=A0AA39HW82_9BILA|nr:hypothetical protein QR680_006237 [Steinernema hermaphroditum]
MFFPVLISCAILCLASPYPYYGGQTRQCGANEEWVQCYTCEEDCQKHYIPCISSCLPANCMCKQGFVRYRGQCLPPDACGGN